MVQSADLIGHPVEAAFPADIALGALAVAAGAAPQALVTGFGVWRGEALALVEPIHMSRTRDHLGRHVVAVTGIGLVTPLGIGVAESWAGLLAGRSGIKRITRFPTDHLRTTIAGQVDLPEEAGGTPLTSPARVERMARSPGPRRSPRPGSAPTAISPARSSSACRRSRWNGRSGWNWPAAATAPRPASIRT